jgi:glutamine amidotransferase
VVQAKAICYIKAVMTSQQRIAVIDYGMGNLRSVANALDSLECSHSIVTEPMDVVAYEKVIIPGVGAFAEAIENLRRTGMFDVLCRYAESGAPILGICLGMQLLCRESTEGGNHHGFGWINARVRRFPDGMGLKIPHMGWNALRLARDTPLFRNVNDGSDVYFVHSYYVECDDKDDVLAYTEHGVEFASIVGRGNIFGMQFHPEKSQHVGIELLNNFVTL